MMASLPCPDHDPARRGAPSASSRCSTPRRKSRRRPSRRSCPHPTLTGLVELRGVAVPLSRRRRRRDRRRLVRPRQTERGHRDHRLDRRRQDHDARPRTAAVTTATADARCSSTASTVTPARARGAGMGADRHGSRSGRTLFTGTVASNLRFGNPDTTATMSCGPRSSSRRRGLRARDAPPAAWRRPSHRAGSNDPPAASASTSRSAARCCASRSCSCSDDARSRRSTSRLEARLRAAIALARPRGG